MSVEAPWGSFIDSWIGNSLINETSEQPLIILSTNSGIPEALLEVPNDWKRCSKSLSRHRSAVSLNVRLTLINARVYTQDPAEGFILNYTLLIGDASFSNFQKVCTGTPLSRDTTGPLTMLLHANAIYLSIYLSTYRFLCQIIDLKGTPRSEQNDLLDFFVTITSTKPELEETSFLTELDMDPSTTSALALATTIAPISSRVASPGIGGAGGAGEALFASLASPPLSNTPSGAETPPRGDANAATKQVFSDIRRLMSFAVRRDTTPQ